MPYKDREQRNAHQRQYYSEHIEERRAYNRAYSRQYKQCKKVEALSHYSNSIPKCACCGIDDIDVLNIDHINSDGAEHRRTIGTPTGHMFYRWLETNNYPAGFQVLCFNCNWKKEIQKRREK